jgi:hypothetical protein
VVVVTTEFTGHGGWLKMITLQFGSDAESLLDFRQVAVLGTPGAALTVPEQ